MILTKKLLDKLRHTDYLCSKLTDEQANRLLLLYSEDPAPEPPYVWDEEHIWLTLRKMIRSN
ncbi:MAG TPA: hypothetical protein GX523_09775 [Desulfitobacterium dehalogenans]|uniref:Uncharacterized protein n=1 Tax=Desulfitobacterium dehalogenans TaxID=36854 RepID=A0A7C7D5V9_9FIRM|nr:hypothetical protein [Desulfitobacterium dehalogenans]